MAKEHGIIFSREMVLALLAGRKTVTRRMSRQWLKLAVGDVLWVRETFGLEWSSRLAMGWIEYAADSLRVEVTTRPFPTLKKPVHGPVGDEDGAWRPAIHMPRWASRITLRVTEPPRIERAQDITAEDVIREGIDPAPHLCGCEVCAQTSQLCTATQSSLILEFSGLWRQLHTKPGERWEDNPEVVRIAFEKVAT
jgi:hypothetical protein